MYIVVAIAALNAEGHAVDGRFLGAGHPDDLAVAHIQIELAADAAVGAGCPHFLDLIGPSHAQTHLVLQCAYRTISHTCATALTTGIQHQLICSGHQLGLEPAVGERPHVPVLDFAASSDAASAKDALVAVDEDEGIGVGIDLVVVAPTRR